MPLISGVPAAVGATVAPGILAVFTLIFRATIAADYTLLVPRPLRDAAYAVVAAVRHRIAGRSNACEIPPPEIRERLI
jgi:predicted DCC family thiol-disulfide oxidoreductase YuxK